MEEKKRAQKRLQTANTANGHKKTTPESGYPQSGQRNPSCTDEIIDVNSLSHFNNLVNELERLIGNTQATITNVSVLLGVIRPSFELLMQDCFAADSITAFQRDTLQKINEALFLLTCYVSNAMDANDEVFLKCGELTRFIRAGGLDDADE